MTDASLRPVLSAQAWLQTAGIQAVFDAIESAGGEARVVGGAVRNSLLGEAVRDVDIATTLVPTDVVRAVEQAGLRAIPTGIDHGTITVLSDRVSYELTTLRQDVETFGRQARVVFGLDWEADAKRRDFTMNALYADRFGEIFDPLGGLADCLSGHVRFIGDPTKRIREDYLRILRFFRFSATYGKAGLDPAGMAACLALKDGLGHLSAERVGAEIKRLLVAPMASQVIAVMAEEGLIGEVLGCDLQVERFQNFLKTSASLSIEPPFTAVLVSLVGGDASVLEELGATLRLSNQDRGRMNAAAQAAHAFAIETEQLGSRKLLYHFGNDAAFWGGLLFFSSTEAALSSAQTQFLNELQSNCVPVFPVCGKDLIRVGIQPGPLLGEELSRLEDIWRESDFSLSKNALLERVNSFNH